LSYDSELQALSGPSANLGRNPLLVQAATGNTSIKVGPKLWIKASGTWLAHAEKKDIFIPVDLARIRDCVDKGTQHLAEYKTSSGASVQPSVETPMHGVMPHRVVIHVHSVNTIAWAVRRDGAAHLAARLAGLAWQWIPYVSSGLPLALQIQRVTSSSPDVLILANHGLVVGGESCGAADALLRDVENRLSVVPRGGFEPQWSELERMAAREPCWRVPDDAGVHALATDATSRAILLGGTLYPCQAVSLNSSTPVISSDERISDSEHRHRARYGVSPTFIIVEATGVLVRRNMTITQTQILLGLSHVVRRIDAEAPIRYLTTTDLDELSTTDAHQYRYAANRLEESIDTSDLRKLPLLGSRK
jgi:rhamnose utilization protein RhaD (predicted bifunctional aldolase and dehydrogenase)